MSDIQAIARAWHDPDFEAWLVNDTRAALADAGVVIRTNRRIKLAQDTDLIRHLVLPLPPEGSEDMSMEQLEQIARLGIIREPAAGGAENS